MAFAFSSLFEGALARCVPWVVLMLLGILCGSALAEPGDPPGRVGRLVQAEGQVWLFDSEANEWITAARNRPITTNDRLSTERGSRAEIRVGSTALRIDEGTELEVAQLDDEHVKVKLHSGRVAVRLRSRETAREFGLLTSEGQFFPDRAGHYRFDREDDTSRATVLTGLLQFHSPDRAVAVAVNPGEQAEFWLDNGVRYQFDSARRDEFSDWVAERDQREERSVSARYVSSEMTGIEDLDRYGRWEHSGEYGALWVPAQVEPGWAPYRMGHWTWVHPWGWTWIDDAPWGFAPFHYGRWVMHRNTWCWAPGQYVARPVYAPALVAWIGAPQANLRVTVGTRVPPTVGWFPLAPREVYVPGHRFSPGYLRGVNVTHVTHIVNVNTIVSNPGASIGQVHYMYRDHPIAVTRIPGSVMERRQPVAPAIIGVHGPAIRHEPVVTLPPVSPGGHRPGTSRPLPVPGGQSAQGASIPPSPGAVKWGSGGRDAGQGPTAMRPGFGAAPQQPQPGGGAVVQVQPAPAERPTAVPRHEPSEFHSRPKWGAPVAPGVARPPASPSIPAPSATPSPQPAQPIQQSPRREFGDIQRPSPQQPSGGFQTVPQSSPQFRKPPPQPATPAQPAATQQIRPFEKREGQHPTHRQVN